jgi:hypothetical protein
MMEILSENSKKECPKSVIELLRLGEKRFVHGICYFINNIPIFIYNRCLRKEKEVDVQSDYIILSDLSSDLY